jgi:hypothetical protein
MRFVVVKGRKTGRKEERFILVCECGAIGGGDDGRKWCWRFRDGIRESWSTPRHG